MKAAKPRQQYPSARSDLRVADLKKRTRGATTLMNVKVPATLFDAISTLAARLGASKTEVVTALLNEGLGVAANKWPPNRQPK